jgi:protoheme IX farnesyltransferase
MVDVVKKYLLIIKPGIVLGNLVPAMGGFLMASRSHVDIFLLLSTLTGISLVVASGCVFNNCIDREPDRIMRRTCNRILARRLLPLKTAVFYGAWLGVTGAALLWAVTNLLSVTLVLFGFTIYVAVYSLYAKRRSIYGALIGSLAGAAPPLTGYCAVTNRFDIGAVILFLIFSLWQMPHCYAIAIFRLDDYAAAKIPVLPVKRGIPATKKHIVGYILAFTGATAMLTVFGYTGYGYLVAVTLLGAAWFYLACSGFRAPDDDLWAKKLIVFSIFSILVLSVMMSIDYTVPAYATRS